MTYPIPRGRSLLAQASIALEDAVDSSGLSASPGLRLRILEAASAWIGGYDLIGFDVAVGNRPDAAEWLPAGVAYRLANYVAQALVESPISASLALATLADAELDPIARRRNGQYFTDSGLALELASQACSRVPGASSVIDPSCGAGALLVAVALQSSRGTVNRNHLVRNVLWGVDRDPKAVRAARAAVSSLTNDLGAVSRLSRRLLVADSLVAGWGWWRGLSRGGFDLVIGNPPWEKLKVTRHEYALSCGYQRWYGEDYTGFDIDEEAFESDRRETLEYRDLAFAGLCRQGRGEADLYKMFLELGARITSESGTLAFLVPAGFIRNAGASELREWLFGNFDVDMVIRDNRQRYFGIDSRFKFLQIVAVRGAGDRSIRFRSGERCSGGDEWKARTSLGELKNFRLDLTIPEVRDRSDWELFARLSRGFPNFGSEEAGWLPRFYREVDMTSDRAKFRDARSRPDLVTLVEGRMVHQHRVAAKGYVGGRGRRALWNVQFPLRASLRPQWSLDIAELPADVVMRVGKLRAGFCDITGQTNERTVLAAVIPQGVVCGNKVPTVGFSSDYQTYAWVGIANSFVFDWLARRNVTPR